MWYHLEAYNSNHSRYCNSIFIRTIMFHNTVTTMLELAKFLTIRERRRFESISTSWEFIPNTNPDLPATIVLGHLWYNSGTHFAGSYRAAQSGTPDARMLRPNLPLGSVWSFPGRGAQQNDSRPELNYSASRSERVIRPAKWEACVQSCQKFQQRYGPWSTQTEIDPHPRPPCLVASLSTSRLVSIFFYPMVLFHDSKYSQPCSGIHLYLAGDRTSPDFYRSKHG